MHQPNHSPPEPTPPPRGANGLLPDPESVAQWIADGRNGSRSAIGRLLQGYSAALKTYVNGALVRKLRGKVGSSDIVQQTLLEAHQSFSKFEGHTAEEFRPWLVRVMKYVLSSKYRSFVRTLKRRIASEQPLPFDSSRGGVVQLPAVSQVSPGDELVRREDVARLAAAIGRLPPRDQQVIRLRIWEQQKWKEVGQAMDCTADAARKLFNRALERLYEDLGGEV